MQRAGIDRDVAGDLAEAEILHDDLAELLQRKLLVLAIHRRAGIDHEAQRGMIELVDRGMLDHHLQDGRHGEHVGDAVLRDQSVGFRDVEALGRQQDGGRTARGLHQLMHAGAMRQRRDHQRGVLLGGARREVGEMVGDDKTHLAMGQHGGLGAACGARGEEEPAGIVVFDRDIGDFGICIVSDRSAQRGLAESALLADPPDEVDCGDRPGMIGEIAMTEKRLRAGCRAEISDFIRHQAEIGGHPDRAEPERREHRPEHLLAILGMHEDAVALGDAALGERRRQRRDLADRSRARSSSCRPR